MTTFNITNVYTSQSVYMIGEGVVEQPYTPKVGEWCRLTVEYDVAGTPRAPYPVSFQIANTFQDVSITDLTPGHKRQSVNAFLALDGEIPWEVQVDPYHYADGADTTKSPMPHVFPDITGTGQGVRIQRLPGLVSNASRKGAFEPIPPPTSIDYYDPLTAFFWHYMTVKFSPKSVIDRMVAIVGEPTTDSWQTVKSVKCSVQSGDGSVSLTSRPVDNPSHYPVFYWDQPNLPAQPVSMMETGELELRNVRVNPDLLRGVSWGKLETIRTTEPYHFYSTPEDLVQSEDPKITAFVHDRLGADFRKKMTPYDAARKLFQAVLERCTYFYPKPGEPDLRAGNAVEMVEKGLGDCGSFSLALVAVFRNIGFAARTACGSWIGLDQWHCWCELFFPEHGWVLCDGAVGNGASESGEFAYFFGYLPNMNQRWANMRGNTFSVGTFKTNWLQGPFEQVFPSATPTIAVHNMVLKNGFILKPPSSDASMKKTSGSGQFSMVPHPELAFRSCPCAAHGGFRASLGISTSFPAIPIRAA